MSTSGRVVGADDEKWSAIDHALMSGYRGLPGRSSLAQLLRLRRWRRYRQCLPPLRKGQIVAWADAHFARTGHWPKKSSGPIVDAPGETWSGVNSGLRAGVRGLPGGDSLPRLLLKHRGVRHHRAHTRLTVRQILAWADAHRQRTGRWPTVSPTPIPEAPAETWRAMNGALRQGDRGLRGGSSLAVLLAARRGVRNLKRLPTLNIPQILMWAESYQRNTGRWPSAVSGRIPHSDGETWQSIDTALRAGARGLPGGAGLGVLLGRPRTRRRTDPPRLSVTQVLAWADAFRRRTRRWPGTNSAAIVLPRGESWDTVNYALRLGARGLPGGFSLSELLLERRGVRSRRHLPPMTESQILAWADAHRARTGAWPSQDSGEVAGMPGETWTNVQHALRLGLRGLPPGSSIARLLAERRGKRNRKALPRLSKSQIMKWARRHYERSGAWPTARSGPVVDAPGESWSGIACAMTIGGRGLAAGDTLPRLLARHGVRRRTGRPPG